MRTFDFPAVIVRPCNTYGPWQYPEKLIPLALLKILRREKVPLYGNGTNMRQWLYVDDCARGILAVLAKARLGEKYNLGSPVLRRNIDVVKTLIRHCGARNDMVAFVNDRPGHDFRYRLNWQKVYREIRWVPVVGFKEGTKLTVQWAVSQRPWLLKKWQHIRTLYT
jgi:dTDP-glucose 4,6-dehydratase